MPGARPGHAVIEVRSTGGWEDPVQSTTVDSGATEEFHCCARPDPGTQGIREQARSAYRNLLQAMRARGIRPSDLAVEKVFLGDVRVQAGLAREVRAAAFRSEAHAGRPAPAMTLVQQPPARPSQSIEIQALAAAPSAAGAQRARPLPEAPPGVSGLLIEAGSLRQMFLAGVTGIPRADAADFESEATSMFRRAAALIAREGFSFQDVVRTWIYLADIDRDYADLNRARNEFFRAHGVDRLPASTGIGGIPDPCTRRCALDLRAILGGDEIGAEAIHAPTMNEASAYGSGFSRGIRLRLPGRTLLYLSGTASIDREGRVVHEGDFEGQAVRTLLNLESLLAAQGAGPENLACLTTYLKRREFLEPFRSVFRRRGFPLHAPHTLCVADVCRREWLCETEAIAVLA